MNSEELAEELADVDATTPYYETLILDLGGRGAWWACNLDGREIDPNVGCPDHAPRDIPGLYRVECGAEPRHAPMWVTDGDHTGYGVPCPACTYNALSEDFAKVTKTDRCYHWGWRRWKLTHWIAGRLYTSGICSSGGSKSWGGVGHDWCLSMLPSLRGRRPYILGVSRDTWHCWRQGHRRGVPVGFGARGKCMPWPCCGSILEAHADGCGEDVDQRAATR